MKETEKRGQSLGGKDKKNSNQDLYGIEPKMSLQSVNYAPGENSLLNEYSEGEDKQCE